MAKKNSGGLFGALSTNEINVLRDKLTSGGTAATVVSGDRAHGREMHEVSTDLHHAWMAAFDRESGK